MNFDAVVARLERELGRELPGAAAHAHLAPIPRREWPSGFNPARIRNAAGLLLVFPRMTGNAKSAKTAENGDQYHPLRALRSLRSTSEQDAHIVLTVRGDALRHGGQVSLPGGVVEPGETFDQAALREAHEEIALPRESVRMLGALTPLDIPVSGFRLHPLVGVSAEHPRFAAADGEVAEILEVAIDDFFDPAHFTLTERRRNGVTLTIPGFDVHGHELWGATAMVVAEFLTLLGWAPSKQR